MNIAIVEDERSCMEQLQNLLEIWSNKHQCYLSITTYPSGAELLSDKDCDYHIVFMDIDLPEISGIQCAQKLRESNFCGHIVFLTAHNEFVFEGYHVRALDYLIKPVTIQALEYCLNTVLHELESSHYIIKTATKIEKIPYSSIIAFATQGHYLDVITVQKTYRHKIALSTIRAMLPEEFVQCHRTLIININHVTKLDGCDVHLTNQSVYPVSKRYLSAVQQAFLNCSN